MSIRKGDAVPVEVDMVPLIDIISLLLMFLVMVGDMSRNATAVKMQLPRADMAKKDDPDRDTSNRLVVQLEKDQKTGAYCANIAKHQYSLEYQGGNGTLLKYLNDFVAAHGGDKRAVPDANGGINLPVKLRIPTDAPMKDAERVIQSMARANLVNIQYAIDNSPPSSKKQ